VTAISATPIEVIQSFNPLPKRECGLQSSDSGLPQLACQNLSQSWKIGFLAVWTHLCYAVFVAQDETIATNNTDSFVLCLYLIGAVTMIKAFQASRNIAAINLYHVRSGRAAKFTLSSLIAVLFNLPLEQLFVAPLPRVHDLVHCLLQRKSPFMSPARVTQRGRFDCISDLLACPSKSVNPDYTAKIELMFTRL
jgi:hypothetical protein